MDAERGLGPLVENSSILIGQASVLFTVFAAKEVVHG